MASSRRWRVSVPGWVFATLILACASEGVEHSSSAADGNTTPEYASEPQVSSPPRADASGDQPPQQPDEEAAVEPSDVPARDGAAASEGHGSGGAAGDPSSISVAGRGGHSGHSGHAGAQASNDSPPPEMSAGAPQGAPDAELPEGACRGDDDCASQNLCFAPGEPMPEPPPCGGVVPACNNPVPTPNCESDADCEEGSCIGGSCVACSEDADCPSETPYCARVELAPATGCCPAVTAPACVECRGGAHCTDPDLPACVDSRCRACATVSQCAEGICSDNECVPECSSAEDCSTDPDDRKTCELGRCQSLPCESDDHCEAPARCSDGICSRSCVADSDCRDGYCVKRACFSAPGRCGPSVAAPVP